MDIIRENNIKIFRNKYIKEIIAFWYRCFFIICQNLYGLKIRLQKNKNKPMVFCIGFSKTGTSSLDKAFSILGYRNVHWLHASLEPRNGWVDYIRKSPFDAFSDSPMYHTGLFKEIDKEFPGSKFILTLRETKSLIKSWKNYFMISPWSIDNNEDIKLVTEMYLKHKNDVIDYFKGRESDLLILDIIGGDGWHKLCKFLNKPIPDQPFPCKRVAKYNKK